MYLHTQCAFRGDPGGRSSLLLAFVLALVVVYLVVAAQFESFVDPLFILFTIPMSLVGATFALSITGSTANLFSRIRVIVLVGLVTKNGAVTATSQTRSASSAPRPSARRGRASKVE